uniref:Inhibitor of CDK, cyclin A1 interacting protein 1 n=1 Tax=Panthera leo TaxID=9689 RepID=A0A8C8XP59_PANLE
GVGIQSGDSGSAECSRVVSRPAPPSQSLTLMPQRYGDLFWESLSQRPRPTWTEEWHIPPSPRATGCSQPGPYPLERLPPPEVLCRRKRRRPHLAGMQQGPAGIPAQVRAVTYHLEDLRRRQRIINEKGLGALKEVEAVWEEGPDLVQNIPRVEGRRETPGETSFPVLPFLSQLLSSLQLLWSPWSPLGLGGSGVPRRLGSLASYSAVPAGRNRLRSPWVMEVQSAE